MGYHIEAVETRSFADHQLAVTLVKLSQSDNWLVQEVKLLWLLMSYKEEQWITATMFKNTSNAI